MFGGAVHLDMFEQAKKAALLVIFIDEYRCRSRQRGAGVGGGQMSVEQTSNQTLRDGWMVLKVTKVLSLSQRLTVQTY